MKRIFALGLIGALAGAIGCTTTPKEKSYTADTPPALERPSGSGKERTPISPGMPPISKRVSAEEIDENNVEQQARRLQNEMSREKTSAMNTRAER